MTTRHYLVTSIIFAFITACGATGNDIESKKTKLEELKQQVSEIEDEITKIEEEISAADTTQKKEPATVITTALVSTGTFEHYIEVQGTAESKENVMISSEMAGTITGVLIRDGDKVSKGQVLVQIDDVVLRNNIEELETSLELAAIIFERQKNLWDQKIGSEIQYLQAKNQKESLEKKLTTLTSQVEKTLVKAPISGTVDEVFAKTGEMGVPGEPMVRIVNLENIYLKADVSETYVASFKMGDNVRINFPSLGVKTEGYISAIGQFINPQNRTFKVEAVLKNKDVVLKPNMLALISFRDLAIENAIMIPTKYIQISRDEDYVFVVNIRDGKKVAKKVTIEMGESFQGKTVVRSGLSERDELVAEGSKYVANGEAISIKNQDD